MKAMIAVIAVLALALALEVAAATARPKPAPVSNGVIVANVLALFGKPAATRHVPAKDGRPAYDCYLFQNARFVNEFCIALPPKAKAGRRKKV